MSTTVFDEVADVAHVAIGQQADLVVVAPATANILSRAAVGQATDLLSATLLVTRAPVIFAPAMHTEMWEHPATIDNVATLRRRGAIVLDPAVGRLTGSDSGPGRLPEAQAIADVCFATLSRGTESADLHDTHIVVSAGGTREPIDPVRFIGNRSSGKQGWALAAAAVARGADVTVVAANVAAADPAGCRVIRVGTAEEMRAAVSQCAGQADAVIMAAAVADFRVAAATDRKIKKTTDGAPALDLVETVDILAEVSQQSVGRPRVVVGFAAETVESDEELLRLAQDKLQRKGADLIVANAVGNGRGFESDENSGFVLDLNGAVVRSPAGTKFDLANTVLDCVAQRLR